jgi:hypothetical protein
MHQESRLPHLLLYCTSRRSTEAVLLYSFLAFWKPPAPPLPARRRE